MIELGLQFGYVGLFLFSFVSSTLIAAPSDILFMIMTQLDFNVPLLFVMTLVGGYLGNLVNYGVGRYGAAFIMSRYLSDDSQWQQRAESLYTRYGSYSLLLSGLPFIGDPLTAVAGAFRVKINTFTFWVILGKVIKFGLLIMIANGVGGLG